MKFLSKARQRGISLAGLIVVLAVLGVIGVFGLKVVPTVLEYQAIKNAVIASSKDGTNPREIQASFDRRATIAYIESITGKDLVIVRNGNEFDVSFAYDKKIPLVGPASLLLEYEGTTATVAKKKVIE